MIIFTFFFSFQALPVCTSHNSLCDVTFDIPSMGIPDFSEPICECPGKDSCAAAKNDPGRTYTQEMISPGKYVMTKLPEHILGHGDVEKLESPAFQEKLLFAHLYRQNMFSH